MILSFKKIAPSMVLAACFAFLGAVNVNGQTILFTDDFETATPTDFTRVLNPVVGFPNGQFNDPANGDVFGIVDNTASFAISDESAGGFPTDTQGIADSTKTDLFLGFNDTANGTNPDADGNVSVTWTFDVSGETELGLSFEIAAMGDFEGTANSSGDPANADRVVFSASFDGGTSQDIVFATADDEGSLTYTLESGTMTMLDDPLVIGTPVGDGTVASPQIVDNMFTNFDFDIPGSGDTLTLTLTVRTDGGAEAIGIDNLAITSGGGGGGVTGDFDGDNDVDCDDIDMFAGNIGSTSATFDLDGSGTVDLLDVELHIETLVVTSNGVTGTLLGDLNCDGQVNVLGDAFALVGNLGSSAAVVYTDGDINLDGQVNVLGDAFLLVGNLGMSNQ